VFEGAWTPLDPRWNFMIVAVPDKVFRLKYPERLRPYIAHFAGSVKPWTAAFPSRYEHHRAWYRQMLRDSPWPNFAAPYDATAGETPGPSPIDRLTEWLKAQPRRTRTTLKSLSLAQNTEGRLPRIAAAKKPSIEELRKDGDANKELASLLDQMISEPADTIADIAPSKAILP